MSRKEPDFKIAITEQTECISDTVGPTSSECANDPSYCTSWPECQTGCAYRSTVSLDRVSQCDISFDAGNQAENLKGLGVELYTVYFDTQGIPEIAERMCDWSSEEVADCPRGGTYAFSGIEIEEVIDQALGSIIIKPNNILIGGLTLSDPDPYASETFIEDWSIDILLSCGSSITDLPVTYSSEGEIIVSDLLYYYCPNKGAYINGSN